MSDDAVRRFEIVPLDESDPAAVEDWAYGACKEMPWEVLVREAGGRHDEDAIARAQAKGFQGSEIVEAAERGCRRGLRDRNTRR